MYHTERLFIDRVPLTWFRINDFERLCALPVPVNATWTRMHAEHRRRAETKMILQSSWIRMAMDMYP